MTKKVDTRKFLPQSYNGIKTELDTIYITSSGDKYLKEVDALCAETQIQQTKKSRERERQVIMYMVDILMSILKENNWGVFYKSKPMETLNLQDDAPLLRINEVDEDILESAVLSFIEKIKLRDLKDWATKEIEDTAPPSPTDLNQTEN